LQRVEEPERRSFEPPGLCSGIDSSALAARLQCKAGKYRWEIPNVACHGTTDGTLRRRPTLESRISLFEFFAGRFCSNIRDAGENGPAPRPRNSGIDALRRSLKQRLDAPVAAVSYPTRKALPQRFISQRIAIADTLHSPGNDQTPCCHCQEAPGRRVITASRRCGTC